MQTVSFAYLITVLFSTVVAAVLATAAWTRREMPGAIPFGIVMVFVGIATVSRVIFVVGPEDMVYTFSRLRISALVFAPPLALVFVLAYTGHRRWAHMSRAWVILIFPVVFTIAVWLRDDLLWSGWDYVLVAGIRNEVMVEYGLLWRLNLFYSYGCFITMIVLLLRALLTSIRPMRSTTISLILGWTIIMLSNLPFAALALGRYIPNLTNVGFAVGGLFFIAALRRGAFFDRVPAALQTVYKSMQDGVIVFDVERRIAAMNPAAEKLVDLRAADVVGKMAYEAFPDRRDLVERFAGGGNQQAEVSIGGRLYDFDFSVLVDNGDFAGRVLVMRDITAIRVGEERKLALALEQERIRLMAGVIRDTSQELRGPLEKITAAVFTAQRATTQQERKDKLTQIETSAAHMTQIIDSLELLADLDVDAHLTLSEFTLRDWLETIPNAVRELIARRNQRLVRAFDTATPITLYADFYLLRSALQQLLQNAALYTPLGGTITLKAERLGDTVEITVSDTGMGIAPDALEAIFDRFTRFNKESDGAGPGVGLAIVRKVIELHGGTVTATSEIGRGSAFTLRLPLRAADS